MYYSLVEATGTGSPQLVAVPPYIDKDHIKVYVDSLPTEAFEWVNSNTISLIAGANHPVRVVRRTSPDERLTAYLNGTSLTGDDLEVDSRQAFFMAQEALDLARLGGTVVGNPAPGLELTTAGILALLAGQITPSQLELSLRERIELIDGPEEVIGTVAWQLLQEANARAADLQAEAQVRAAALIAEAQERGTAITQEATLREEATEALAQQITTLTAAQGSTVAAVQSEQSARVTADEALSDRIDTVVASSGGSLAAVEQEATARANADNAIASSVETIRATLADADSVIDARVTSETTTRVTADNALANRIAVFEATGAKDVAALTSRVTTAEQAIVTEGTARATAVSQLDTAYKAADTTLQSNITSEQSARSNADTALANRATALEAKVNLSTGETVKSLIADEATARASADGTNATNITSVQSSVTGLTTRMGAVETSASTSASKVAGVEANYTIKVQARLDGKSAIAGIGINSTVNTNVAQSEMVFLADKFTFVPSATDINAVPQPLLVAGLVNGVNTLVVPASRIGDKLVPARVLVDGILEARHFSADLVTAAMINANGLVIKAADGTPLFGAGVNLGYQYITASAGWLNSNVSINANGTLSGAGGGQVTYAGVGGKALGLIDSITPSNASTYIADAWIGQAIVNGQLQSSNYVSGLAGWALTKSGNMEVYNLVARGNIWASAVYTDAVNTAGVQANAITSLTSSYTPGGASYAYNANSFTATDSLTFTGTGAPIVVWFSCSVIGSGYLRILRNGTVVVPETPVNGSTHFNYDSAATTIFASASALSFTDTGTVGSVTYTVEFRGNFATSYYVNGNQCMVVSQRSLIALEKKR